MILQSKLDKPFDECTIRSLIWIKCDYCGAEMQRVKKSVIKLRKNLEKDTCGNRKCTQLKREEIFTIKYGISNPNSKENIERQKIKNLEKHGCESYFQTEEFKQKRKQKLIAKLGVDSPLKNAEVQKKHKKTCLERYGVENYSQFAGFDEKRKNNSLKKYKVESPSQLEEVKEKRKFTNTNRYGVENYTQTQEFKERYKKQSMLKFGVDHPSKCKSTRDKAKATCRERYGEDNYAKTQEFKERYIKTCLQKYGVPNPLIINQTYGKAQKEMQDWLNSLGYNFQPDYSLFPPKEIDLYDAGTKLAIEYCGLFWHNEMSLEPRGKDYHYNKYLACKKKNIRLLTIFEDEWRDKKEICKSRIKSVLGLNQRIFARKCDCMEISKQEFNNFCNLNHLQSENNLGIVYFGLYHQNEIVGAISLGRHHRNKKQIVLDRLCFKMNSTVIGGSSKLFRQCVEYVKKKRFLEIISWSDNRWSEGGVYVELGFELEQELKPDYSYTNYYNPTKRISKQSQKKSNTGCPPDMTEKEFALQNGLARIWDCGKKRWIYKVN